MAAIALRDASDAEILAIFRARADNVVATVDGQPVAYARFQTIEDRRWAFLDVFASIAPADVTKVFYAFKRRLRQERQPVYVLAQSAGSIRLLRLLSMEPTGESSAGKEVWLWKPRQ